MPAYTIRSGETLSEIAQRYGMTWRELYDLRDPGGRPNSERLRSGDPDLIYPGEIIWVPKVTAGALVWPSNEREPRKVGHGYGDSESSTAENPPYKEQEFHHGIDIPGTASGPNATKIIAVTGGTLRRWYPNGTSGAGYILEPEGGGDPYVYAHVRERRGWGTGPFKVRGGVHILFLARDPDQPPINWMESTHVCDHLHFQIGYDNTGKGSVKNPLQDLDTDSDEHDLSVKIKGYRYFKPNENQQTGTPSTLDYLTDKSTVVKDAPILRSDIVIIVEGEDKMGYNNWTPGLHKLEYEVKDGPKPTAKIDTMKLFEWNGGNIPADQYYKAIYNMGKAPCETTLHFNYYIVTNTDNKDPIDNNDFQYWATKAKAAGAAKNGVGADKAKLNSQAFFPDGKYTVEVTGYDINADWDSDENQVVLDNFKPYVKQVIVKVGDTVKYNASWPETAAGSLDALKRTVDEPCVKGKLTFEIYFSETMDDAWADFKVEIQPSGSSDWINVSDNASWSKGTFDNDKWTGEVTLPSDAGEGEAKIRIKARDLAENKLDTDPKNVAEFDIDKKSWSNDSPGSDENHRIKIEASKGSFTAKIAKKAE